MQKRMVEDSCLFYSTARTLNRSINGIKDAGDYRLLFRGGDRD